MSSSPEFDFPSPNTSSLPVLDLHDQLPVTGDDEEEQRIDRYLRGVESRATKYVTLSQIEWGHSDYNGQNHQSAGRDEVNPPTRPQQLNRPNSHFPSDQSPESSKRVLRPTRRSDTDNTNKCKSRKNFSKDQVQILLSWHASHEDDPYPEGDELTQLAAKTGLTTLQVRDWLKRRRTKRAQTPISHKQSFNSSNASISQFPADFDTPVFDQPLDEAQSPLTSPQENLLPYPSDSPLDTYLGTPPKDDVVLRSTAESVQSDNDLACFSVLGGNGRTVSRQGALSPTTSGTEIPHEPLRPIPHSSQQSGYSVQGSDTAGTPNGKKGRRIIRPPPVALERDGIKKLQCVWCNRGYRYRSDWARHMASHYPHENWICMYQGPRLISKGEVTCAFCEKSNPEDEHFNSEHTAFPCYLKPEHERTFTRSDGLRRHMRGIHKADIQTPPISWRVPVHENDTQHFWCGFCGEVLRTTWESRLNHFVDHFERDNLDMTQWRVDTSTERETPDDFLTAGTTLDPYFSEL